MSYMQSEDIQTNWICIGPVNKVRSVSQYVALSVFVLQCVAVTTISVCYKVYAVRRHSDELDLYWSRQHGVEFVAGCCRVLQDVAGCCRVLQGVAGCCRVLQSVAGCCGTKEFGVL